MLLRLLGFATCGLASSLVERDYCPPQCPPAAGDYTASTFLAYGIMLALFHRERTDEGQMVHASLLGSLITVASCCIDICLVSGQDIFGWLHESENAIYNCYQTRDKRWIQVALVQDEPTWLEFCQAMGIEHLIDDPRFNTAEARRDNNTALISVFDEVFLTRDQRGWIERLDRYDFPWAPVKNFTELASDPQLIANDYIMSLDDPAVGEVKVAGVTVELSKTPGKIASKAPELGQHTEEILLEMGYTWDDIAGMKEEGAII